MIDTLGWVLLLAALLPAAAFVGLGAWHLKARTADVHGQLDRASRVAAEHAARVYETHEMLLRRVFEAIGDDDDARIAAREPELHRRLKAMTADLPQVQSVRVWDAGGRPLLGSRVLPAPRRIVISDREYFRWHRDHAGGSTFITEAPVARATGEVFSDLSLLRETPDGRFAGVVTVGLHVRYLEAFHAELARDLKGASL